MQVELLEMKSTNDSELKLITFAAMVSKEEMAELLAAEKKSVIHLGVKWLVWSLNLVRVATLTGAIDGYSLMHLMK